MLSSKCCVLLFAVIGGTFANINANFHCADLEPQQHVSIEQLMGMWYGIEIISHRHDAPGETEYSTECPVIYFFEDKNRTFPSLYDNVNYGQTYGTPMYDTSYQDKYRQQQYQQQQDPYNTRTYSNYDRDRIPHKVKLNFKRLRMWWVEYENGVEYRLKYNDTKPGLWISSGPQNGSYLEPQFNHFAGTIMVLKAVGSHLVLTFCYQMPDKKLYTVVLGREHNLTSVDIHGVHNLLIRKGLDIVKSRKVCALNAANPTIFNTSIISSSLALLLLLYRVSS